MNSRPPTRRTQNLARVAQLFALVFALLATATFLQIRRGRAAIERSTAALNLSDTRQAILDAIEAARARAPFSRYPDLGYARLFAIATDAEAKGDFELAEVALDAVASAARSSQVGASPSARETEAVLRKATLRKPKSTDAAQVAPIKSADTPSHATAVAQPGPAEAGWAVAFGALLIGVGAWFLSLRPKLAWAVIALGCALYLGAALIA